MGVPAFFKWLSVRYPQCIADAIAPEDLERMYQEFRAEQVVNTNPSIDNLYLDMNGIIHPCCHPQGKA